MRRRRSGRFFGASDDAPPAGNPVVVLGDAYWRRAYGGDRSVLGQQIVIGEQPFTIIGVARAGFNGEQLAAVDLFLPLSATMRGSGSEWSTNHGMKIVSVVVRLRDGVSLATARTIATAAIRGESPADRATLSVDFDPVVPGSSSRQSAQSRIALWLAAVSLIVLLIATANVGTLLSLRAARRRREIAVRIAIGAGRGHLARQLVSESVLLASGGAAAGILLSHWFSGIIRSTLLPNLAPTNEFIDARVLAVSIVAAGVAGVLAALAPIAQVGGGGNLASELRTGGAGASARMRFQNALVTIQVALCMLLVVGAALFVRSLERIQSQDLGFSAEHLLYVTLDFHGFVSGSERDAAYLAAVDRVRALAGVTGATVAAGIPFGPHNIPPMSMPNLPWPPVNVQIPIMYAATPDYLDIMRVRLVGGAGRLFSARDTRGSPQVVLVNETLARTAWPGASALGKCIRVGGMPTGGGDENPAASQPCREVVGVVRDARARSLLPERNEDRLMQYYVPFDQIPDPPFPDIPRVMGLVVRVPGDPLRMVGRVQRAIQSSSTHRVFALIRPYQDLIDPQLRSWQLGATLFSAFSAIALGIATIGLFGVISYVATQRTQEMGIRRALGGNAWAVARLVVGDALRRTVVGLAFGVVAVLLAGPVVAAMLFQTSPRDPASVATAGAILLVATLVAASWPALRATRVNPMVALRAE